MSKRRRGSKLTHPIVIAIGVALLACAPSEPMPHAMDLLGQWTGLLEDRAHLLGVLDISPTEVPRVYRAVVFYEIELDQPRSQEYLDAIVTDEGLALSVPGIGSARYTAAGSRTLRGVFRRSSGTEARGVLRKLPFDGMTRVGGVAWVIRVLEELCSERLISAKEHRAQFQNVLERWEREVLMDVR